MKTRALRWAVAALALLLAATVAMRVVASRRAAQETAASSAKTEAVVELAAADVARIEALELVQGLPISGSLKAVDTAAVKARVSGELQDLAVREGDQVRAGQVIARVEPAEYQARLAQAREQADAAKAQIDIAQRQYDNNKALVDQGYISRTALETSQSNLNSALASHKAALAAADVARKAVEDTVLRAPIGGVMSQRLAQPGERVSVDTRILEIVDLRRLELEATLSAADSMQLRMGQRAQLAIEGTAKPVAATVVRINPSAQAASRSVLAYLSISDTSGLRQGLFAQGTLNTASVQALAAPLAAVRTDKPEPYVQLVENNRIVHRKVETGARGTAGQKTMVAVNGLAAGAMVVEGHVGPLREGTAVKFTQAQASVGSASQRTAP